MAASKRGTRKKKAKDTQAEDATVRTARRFAELQIEKNKLEDRITAISAQQQEMMQRVLVYFEKHGVDRIKFGEITLFPRCAVRAARVGETTNEEIIDALKKGGFDEFTTPAIGWSKLSAYIRELHRNGEPLPRVLEGRVYALEMWDVGAQKS